MKNILIATDFSKNSLHALKFGMELAKEANSKVFLFHFFALPLPYTENAEVIDYSSYETIKSKQLNKLQKKLKNYSTNIELICVSGISFVNEIVRTSEEHKIDLVVMGLTGTSMMEDLFLGSNTLSVLLHSKIPTLAIPINAKFKENFKMAFAYDGQDFENKKSIAFLSEFAKLQSIKIHAFNVSTAKHDLELYRKLKVIIPIHLFSMETVINKNVDDGILDFITSNKIDLLALVHRKHNFFDRIFHESHTKKIAKIGNFPLLVLPE